MRFFSAYSVQLVNKCSLRVPTQPVNRTLPLPLLIPYEVWTRVYRTMLVVRFRVIQRWRCYKVGNYRRLLARFPIGDVLEDYTTVSSNEDYSLTEKINVGISDITRSNPNTQTLNLHQGEIQNVNTDIIVRYLEDKKMKRVPAEFGDTGFFTLGLLFSKRIK